MDNVGSGGEKNRRTEEEKEKTRQDSIINLLYHSQDKVSSAGQVDVNIKESGVVVESCAFLELPAM
jgi:hypothetical protein